MRRTWLCWCRHWWPNASQWINTLLSRRRVYGPFLKCWPLRRPRRHLRDLGLGFERSSAALSLGSLFQAPPCWKSAPCTVLHGWYLSTHHRAYQLEPALLNLCFCVFLGERKRKRKRGITSLSSSASVLSDLLNVEVSWELGFVEESSLCVCVLG